jgi:hypothetical protein
LPAFVGFSPAAFVVIVVVPWLLVGIPLFLVSRARSSAYGVSRVVARLLQKEGAFGLRNGTTGVKKLVLAELPILVVIVLLPVISVLGPVLGAARWAKGQIQEVFARCCATAKDDAADDDNPKREDTGSSVSAAKDDADARTMERTVSTMISEQGELMLKVGMVTCFSSVMFMAWFSGNYGTPTRNRLHLSREFR